MKDKEKQIEEMASDMDYGCTKRDLYPSDAKEIAKALYSLGYRKFPEDSVVLSREELEEKYEPSEKFMSVARELEELKQNLENSVVLSMEEYEELQVGKDFDYGYHEGYKNTEAYYENFKLPEERKETAEKFANEIKAYIYDNDNLVEIVNKIAKQFNVEIKE